MTDDITTRLAYDGCDEPACNMIRGDALIEIETLRAELVKHQLPQRISNAKAIWEEMGFDND